MATCLVGLGSNLGDRAEFLDRAVALLEITDAIQVTARSTYFATRAASNSREQPEFLNAAARCETSLTPHEFLQALQSIENQLGRKRRARWSSRTVDLDLLLYDQSILDSVNLVVPHPRMTYRRFVLEPAVEVGATLLHPLTKWTISHHLAWLDTAPDLVALGGGSETFREEVARQASGILACAVVEKSGRKGKRAVILARDSSTKASRARKASKFTISVNWIDPTSTRVCVERRQLFADLAAVAGGFVAPKLLIYFEHESQEACGGVARAVIRPPPYHYPALVLKTSDVREAVDEVVAAIEAMEPN